MQALAGSTSRIGASGRTAGQGPRAEPGLLLPAPSALGTGKPFFVKRNLIKPDYEYVLEDARAKRTYEIAREKFEKYLQENPRECKAWVSYAMMEKRNNPHSPEAQHRACRAILQRGLQLNPNSTCIIQAFGLLELRRNNSLAALMMLERCVRLDPKLHPVLNWSQVVLARQAVEERQQRRRKLGAVDQQLAGNLGNSAESLSQCH
mmetsp:Transcript_10585/g.28979  ORF Transcript_10585/g.28979 Transcript_10585/m.28979 type:complete len:206 (+) Transcript_10585:1438-2055(+)|eukprot:CAMPEP_0202381850 /NCGR_PEP_ID=MMETSP1127-20130417/39167_1 /ASSEMBLY_ACC=CAM_ASM_000462 /TAXON_ID=3047 /ORGANISM="Dunaliella tertiolecta, Strain CCMP1320" /LENGTH=205 /DNA_ID=CAMNT_0048980925 /DNA_START=1370 /DNA_END=1990 /DNA_ORIENTATION=-